MGIWDVKQDHERAQWTFIPHVSAGPLRFGISPDEVGEALMNTATVSRQTYETWPASGSPSLVATQFTELGVTAYYEREGETLAGVAVDALAGPQVTLDGTALVAQVPSEAETWLLNRAEAHELNLLYTHAADPGSADLGLIMRAQRAGDIVLTRPLFLVREWAENSWDCIPGSEWSTF
ncbi:hypothetical protein [Streptomyces sp. AC555_RSS877]|uniref:hypothetical protein n=1 Tax=Streptomyces sp. AC555_RSS877 TaxID=2823688 RepID=UPI001C27BFF9|nr:hypothetical protein [Streptomyces sp. AC555_RSS877]